jgi:uncharacterized protein YciI
MAQGQSSRDFEATVYAVLYTLPAKPTGTTDRPVRTTGATLGHDHYLAQAAVAGTVLAAGPLTPGQTELVVFQARNDKEAEQWVANDPGVKNDQIKVEWLKRWELVQETWGPQRRMTVPRPGGGG